MTLSLSPLYDDGTVTNRALQPYLDAVVASSNAPLNDSSSTTAVVRAVVHKLLQDSNIFVGYNIMKQHLMTKASIDVKVLKTLDLFSYGTVADYMVDKEHTTYLTLTEAQLTKLRQLTALSVIIDRHHQGIVSYYDIHAAAFANRGDNSSNSSSSSSSNDNSPTFVTTESDPSATATTAKATTIRETESLLFSLIASKMIVGKLSQKKMSFILGIGHDTNTQSKSENTSATTGGSSIQSGTGTMTDSTFSKSLLVIQSRDVQNHGPEAAPTNVLPKLLSSIQHMRTQINDAHQHLFAISQSEQHLSLPSSLTTKIATDQSMASSTMMINTMPMEVERIRLTTTTTSAKRSRCSDGSTQSS